MGKALICDRCGAVINFSEAKHTTMFHVEWYPYISVTGTSMSNGRSSDICADCINKIFKFIKEDEEDK